MVRLDVFARAEDVVDIIRRLREARPKWRVREHRPIGDERRRQRRQREPAPAPPAAPAAAGGRPLRLATWNVCGLARERDEVRDFVRRNRLDIFAFQETRLSGGRAYPLTVRGASVFESHASRATGALGLALGVSHQLPAVSVFTGPHHQWVRVAALLPDRAVFVCNVYCKKGEDVLAQVGAQAAHHALSGAEVLILGDFNCKAVKAQRRMARVGFSGTVVRVSDGQDATFHGRGRWRSAIDHMIASPLLHACFTQAVVKNGESRSDHWPLVARVAAPVAVGPPALAGAARGRRAARLTDPARIAAFVCHNRFAELAALEDGEGAGQVAATTFPKALQECLEQAGAFRAAPAPLDQRPGARRQRGEVRRSGAVVGFRLSRRAREAVEARDEAFKRLRIAPPGIVARDCWRLYAERRRAAVLAVREEAEARVAAAVQHRVRLLKRNPSGGRAYWRALAALRVSPDGEAPPVAPAGVPIRDEAGQLLSDEREAGPVWSRHFARLIGEPFAGPVPPADAAPRPELRAADGASLDRPFAVQDMLAALRALKAHKAAGADGVPVEILKLADEGKEGATNAFGQAMLRACNAMFDGGNARECLERRMTEEERDAWHCVRLRPILKKGGDSTLPSAYRGIGIQQAVARLLAMMLLQRVAPAVEFAGLLRPTQAGFRSFEEAVAQVATLLEVCGRRRAEGKATYLLFVDFAAAYDSVPSALLLSKLRALGFPQRVCAFIERSLQWGRAEPAVGATRGEPFSVRRGLVQGCPLSPLLFNLFIGDLLTSARGVRVPGLGVRVSDLKYADDVVALARSVGGLRRQLRRVEGWAAANGMRLGAAKCGIMVVGSSADDTAARHAELEGYAWGGGGGDIPVVSSYRYLGVQFNGQLDLSAMARVRAQSARIKWQALRHALCDRRVPLAERVLLTKSQLVPVVLYGAELWAGSARVVRPLELLLNEVWCAVLGVPRTASLFCVRRTVQCKSVRVASLVATARALAKWPRSRTLIRAVLEAPVARGQDARRHQRGGCGLRRGRQAPHGVRGGAHRGGARPGAGGRALA